MNYKNSGSVLIVDDNLTNIQVLGEILKKSNYFVNIAMSGGEALQFLEYEKVEIILLDIMMPDLDGYEVCRRLKKDNRFKHIPVIFLTAKNQTEDIIKGFEVGAVDYVTKPYNKLELLARVSVHVNLIRSIREINELRTYLPICASCKSIRNDEGYWEQIEKYFQDNSDIKFSHSICPTCKHKLYPDLYDEKGILIKKTKKSDNDER
ncbi:MAG: response regulator [Candidatus Delongbacteria bacterium]|nr:response regulator [Candidatus Delongbacteria bacterium]MBN2835574.1 response regulator [Candidatus Delongbacteria bacterium]